MAFAYVLFQRRRLDKLFSEWCLDELVATNRVLLCGAGFLSLVTLLENKNQ